MRATLQYPATIAVGFFVGLIGLLILFRGLIDQPIASTLWADGFDPNLIYWMLEWGYHKLTLSGDWLNFWNANQFFPHANSLAYSESLVSLQLFYAPLRLLGLQPLEALYSVLSIYTLIACVLTDYALIRVRGFAWYERALIIYVAHFSMAITNFLVHYQLFAFEMAPPFLLFYFLFLRDLKGQYLLALSILFMFAVGFSTYFAPLLGVVCLILLTVFFGRARQAIQVNGFIKSIYCALNKIGIKYFLISVFIMGLLFLVQLKPYLKLFSTLRPQDWNETIIYSAKAWSFFVQASTSSLFYPVFKFANGYWEYSYFPGLILLAFSILGCVLIVRGIMFGVSRYKNICPADQLLFGKYIAFLFFVALILSLGPLLKGVYMPFALFAKLIPGVDSIRTPGRFGMLLGLSLGVFTVYAIRYLYIYLPKKSAFLKLKISTLTVILIFLIAIDGALSSKIIPFSIPHQEFYIQARNQIDEHEPLAIFPLAKEGHLETVLNYMDQLKGSTIHFGWLVTGYGSRSTVELDSLVSLDREFQDGKISFEIILQKTNALGIRKIIIFPEDYSGVAHKELTEFISLKRDDLEKQCFKGGCILRMK